MATNGSEDLNTYDGIAESWYRLRHRTRFSHELTELAGRWRQGHLLNVGCGHGPDFIPFKDNFELWGLDSSSSMLRMAVRHAHKYNLDVNLIAGDAVRLPFKSSSFDWAVSVAAYHHIRTGCHRLEALRELKRVLKPDGEVFITVWNRWQKMFLGKGGEAVVPWRSGEVTAMRYYYLFTYPEIRNLLNCAGFSMIKTYPEFGYRLPVKYFSRNICVLARSA